MAAYSYDESWLRLVGWAGPADAMTIVGPFIIIAPMYLLCLIVPDPLLAKMSPAWGSAVVILWSSLIWALVAFLVMSGCHRFKKCRAKRINKDPLDTDDF